MDHEAALDAVADQDVELAARPALSPVSTIESGRRGVLDHRAADHFHRRGDLDPPADLRPAGTGNVGRGATRRNDRHRPRRTAATVANCGDDWRPEARKRRTIFAQSGGPPILAELTEPGRFVDGTRRPSALAGVAADGGSY